MTRIMRGFVSISEGQVHYRYTTPAAADGNRLPLWMVHASPASSIGLVGLMHELGRTRAVVAPDTLGNGDSAPPAPASPDIAYYAQSSLRVMDALGIEKADLYGSHTGAHIVAEMAIAQPDRFGRMILDGIGMFSAADKQDLLANYAPAMQPDAFGTQFHWAWHFVRDQGWFFPWFRRDAAHLRGTDAPSTQALHEFTLEVLKALGTYHLAYRAAFAHADYDRLPLVRIPTLVMAEDTDPLKAGVAEAVARIPGACAWLQDNAGAEGALAHKAERLAAFLATGEAG